ncbi:DUF892 family protein [Aureimonas frigidaquae]|uniref:DUF2383 domain-containing protein n=1 Tax=Aureimonas frigidaquae TaxID=424757 RepID=A0A0P0Z1X9_9HYPH|nr:ferritin-like domain-containing protein [Aureimonas frigidaquae]BAT27701.1 hypothetical protein [Aureimonas frigidaquae]
MVTTVGTETTFEKLVENLLILEHDAMAAYESTIERLDDPQAKAKIGEFLNDHRQHVAELTRLASTLGIDAPREGDAKEWLTTGKVALASLVGDKTILKAMSSNETDTCTAYDEASRNAAASEEARGFFRKAYADEVRHKTYMDQAATA